MTTITTMTAMIAITTMKVMIMITTVMTTTAMIIPSTERVVGTWCN